MLILLHHLLLSSIHLLLLLLSVLLLLLVGLLLLVLLLSHLLLLLMCVLLLLVLLLTHLTLATTPAAGVMGGTRLRLLLARPAHLLVIGLVLGENLLSHLLSTLVDIRIELVAILFDGEFLVVVNWYVDLLSAYGFFFGIMELSDVRVLQSLLSRQSFIGVELQK